jgi:hypothetical protein
MLQDIPLKADGYPGGQEISYVLGTRRLITLNKEQGIGSYRDEVQSCQHSQVLFLQVPLQHEPLI